MFTMHPKKSNQPKEPKFLITLASGFTALLDAPTQQEAVKRCQLCENYLKEENIFDEYVQYNKLSECSEFIWN